MMTHCDQCSIKFNLLKKKYTCEACQLSHCNDCLRNGSPSSNSAGAAPSSQFQSQSNSIVAGINTFANIFITGSNTSSSNRAGNSRRSCRKCQVFMQWPINVQAVSALRVKDLRFYLGRHNINASTCTEKNELIALVVNQLKKYRAQQQQRQPPSSNHQQQASNNSFANTSCYSRHTDQAISHSVTPLSSSVIRDDGIRVQGMNASEDISSRSNYYDSDSIRVFATRSSPVSNRGNESPTSTAEDDFVLLGHEDLLGPTANNSPTSSVTSTPTVSVHSAARDSHSDKGMKVAAGGGSEDAATGRGPATLPSSIHSSTNSSILSEKENASTLGTSLERNSREEAHPSLHPSLQVLRDDPPASTAQSVETPSASATATSVVVSQTSAKLSELDYIKLETLTSEAMVRGLTVRQCRVLLAKHRVTTTAIIEKEQLVDRVLTLWRSYKQNKQSVDELPDRLLCKICMEAAIDCVLLECSHMVCCTDCGRQLAECPICRQYVVRCVHTFLA